MRGDVCRALMRAHTSCASMPHPARQRLAPGAACSWPSPPLAYTPRSWPKDADEWKRLLSRAAPWLAAAAIVAASAYGYRKDRAS